MTDDTMQPAPHHTAGDDLGADVAPSAEGGEAPATPRPIADMVEATRVRTMPYPQVWDVFASAAMTVIPLDRADADPTTELLFLTQQAGSDRIFFLRPSDASVIRWIDPEANDTIGGMAFDGSHILVANVGVGAGVINRIDPNTGAQVGSIPAPPGPGEGMAYFDRHIYYSTLTHIHKIDPASGTVLWSFPAHENGCRGLAAGDGVLFSVGERWVTVFHPDHPNVVFGRIHVAVTGEALAYDEQRHELFVAKANIGKIWVFHVTM